jgi:C4-dicarboxylate-specific signal transduction histidine kinase
MNELEACRQKVRILQEALKQNYHIQKQLEDANEELNRLRKEIAKQQDIMIEQQKLAAMGEMIGNIAHQWRQPLNALGLVLQNIKKAYERGRLDDAYIEKSINKGKMLTSKMSTTIDDFRNLIKAKKLKESFYIRHIIDDVIEIVQASFKNHNIELQIDCKENLKTLSYPNELFQVLINIANNAKDAFVSRDKIGYVSLRCYDKNNNIFIEILDNAGGISLENPNKIFEPYFTTKDDGTGIGLYMSKIIIEKDMNGTLCAQNKKELSVSLFRWSVIGGDR